MYTDTVLDHFKNPRNQGEIKDPDGVGQVGNPVCGDVMKVYIKVEEKKDNKYIKDIKFETLGCGAAIATSSMLTEIAKGKPLDDALAIKKQDIVDSLGGLPEAKIHCSILATEALKKAVDDYKSRK